MAQIPVLSRIGFALAALTGRNLTTASESSPFQAWLDMLAVRYASRSGVRVGLDTAMKVSAVRACARVLAEGVAQIPWKLQRRFEDGTRQYARDLPLYQLLYRRPNEWQTSFEFREMLMNHAVLTGNAYAWINRDGTGRVTELIPLIPNRVSVQQMPDYSITYTVSTITGESKIIPRVDMFHLRGPTWDGVVGLDAVAMAREAIGLACSLEETQADMQKNGLRTTGVIGVQGTLGEDARKRLRERIREFKREDAMGVLILDQAAKFSPMNMTAVDAQLIPTRALEIEEICRHFRVFPQMVMQSDKTSTYASAEQFFIAHVIHSLQPWVERWEQAAERDLIGDLPAGADYDLIAKMVLQGLMRGDDQSRAEFYASGIQNGWLLRSDAREYEDLGAIPGLNVPLVALNLGPSGTVPAPGTVASAIALVLAEDFGRRDLAALIEAKVGRAISAVNEQKLAQARDLIGQVLASLEGSSTTGATA